MGFTIVKRDRDTCGIKCKRKRVELEVRVQALCDFGREQRNGYLQAGEGGRSTARPPAKPAPGTKQQWLPFGANVGLRTPISRVEMQSRDLGTYPPILCREKVRCLRRAIQTQLYTDWGAKFGRLTSILAIEVPPSFALSCSPEPLWGYKTDKKFFSSLRSQKHWCSGEGWRLLSPPAAVHFTSRKFQSNYTSKGTTFHYCSRNPSHQPKLFWLLTYICFSGISLAVNRYKSTFHWSVLHGKVPRNQDGRAS